MTDMTITAPSTGPGRGRPSYLTSDWALLEEVRSLLTSAPTLRHAARLVADRVHGRAHITAGAAVRRIERYYRDHIST